MESVDYGLLDEAGLNLRAVFAIEQLPAALRTDLRRRFDLDGRYRQLILFGHGGKRLWQAVQTAGLASADPIDDFSVVTVDRWLASELPSHSYRILYPGGQSPGLQMLGQLAGWHHATPFMVGINETWGSWYAYRVLLLADTDLPQTPPLTAPSPCAHCADQPCRPACPAQALAVDGFNLAKCIAYRQQPTSACRTRCVARLACPVGAEHCYDDEQTRHCYSLSLRDIERYC